MTMKELLDACKRAAQSDATFTWAPAKWLEAKEVSAWQDMPVWVPSAEATLSTVNASKAIARGLKFRSAEDTARDTLAWWNGVDEERRSKPPKAGITAEREAELLAALKQK